MNHLGLIRAAGRSVTGRGTRAGVQDRLLIWAQRPQTLAGETVFAKASSLSSNSKPAVRGL